MFKQIAQCASLAALAVATAAPVHAQEAGEINITTSLARTKLVDKGTVYSDGVLDPSAEYKTRKAWHSIVTLSYFPIDHLAIEGSVSTPATTNNLPGGSLAGLPNLGDDEFILATAGAAFYPIKGPVRPYVGGGVQFQITTQERDGLAVGLNIPSTHGIYVEGGVKLAVNDRIDVFASARKAWYSTHATGLLPLDATYTNFARIDAFAQLDPVTFQVGIGTRFGRGTAPSAPLQPRQAGDVVVKIGVTNLSLADKIDLTVGGAPLANTALSTFEHRTVSAQVAYFLTDTIAVNATLGFPPKIDVYGAGSIGPLPKLGEVRYGPTAFTVQYHPVKNGRIRPYAGIGASYMIVFDTKDGAFQDLKVSNDLAWAFELGADIKMTDRFGLFLDAKKALLRPTATGTYMGNAVQGQTRLDPWALSTGLSIEF